MLLRKEGRLHLVTGVICDCGYRTSSEAHIKAPAELGQVWRVNVVGENGQEGWRLWSRSAVVGKVNRGPRQRLWSCQAALQAWHNQENMDTSVFSLWGFVPDICNQPR